MNFIERFSKVHQIFLYKMLSAEGRTKRGTDIMNRISQFCYTITNALHIYRRPKKFMAFLQTVEPMSHYCLSGQHTYTRGPLADTNALISGSPDFKYHTKVSRSKSHCRIVWWHFLLCHYNCLPDTSHLL
jgi:hypothetical protein